MKVLRRIAKPVLLSLSVLILVVVSAEISLDLSSSIYKLFYRKTHLKGIENKNCKYVFIGDSWVEGGEAPSGKGFPDQFIQELKKKSPSKDCAYKKLCWSASNSSQAVLQLISALKSGNFEWAIVLTGANNGWNAESADEIDRFAYELYGWGPVKNKSQVSFFTRIGLRRLGRFVSLYNYNISIAQARSASDQYPWFLLSEISDILGSKDAPMEQVREFLVTHPYKAKDYQEFFMAVKLTFGNQYKPTESFLRSKGMWKPELINDLKKERRNDENLRTAWQRAERDLHLMAKLCKENKKHLILFTYPSPWASFDTVNNIIRKVAREENVVLIDQDIMFKEKLKSASDWTAYCAKHHPNEKGYSLMAKNLVLFFKDE